MVIKKSLLTWLLDSDPSIRWQVLRDLADADRSVAFGERSKIAETGWGAALLAQQTPSGFWEGDDFTMLRTIYCLGLLKDMGLDPQHEKAQVMISRAASNLRWDALDGRPFFDGETEPCVNGKILAAGSYFGIKCSKLLDLLLSEQLEDGGWNCDAPQSKRSSFHTTIAVLEGILAYEEAFGGSSQTGNARARAEEYLLERKLFRRHSTGEIIDKAWMRFHFPPTWHYDLLRGLEYMRTAQREPDERMGEAIEIVRLRRHQNGRWPIVKPYREDLLNFNMETQVGSASRWNTLRALRVLKWYESFEAQIKI
jgi:hypothetical protein